MIKDNSKIKFIVGAEEQTPKSICKINYLRNSKQFKNVLGRN